MQQRVAEELGVIPAKGDIRGFASLLSLETRVDDVGGCGVSQTNTYACFHPQFPAILQYLLQPFSNISLNHAVLCVSGS